MRSPARCIAHDGVARNGGTITGDARNDDARGGKAIPAVFVIILLFASCASTKTPITSPYPAAPYLAAPDTAAPGTEIPGTGTAPADDAAANQGKWTRVQSPADFAGDWAGHVDVTVPRNEQAHLPKSSMRIIMTLRYQPASPRISVIMRVDMERIITDYVNSETMKSRGFTVESLWEMMEEELRSHAEMETGRYFLSTNLSDTPENILASRSGITFYLDSSRTALRMVFDQTITFNLGDRGFSELTLYRTSGGVL